MRRARSLSDDAVSPIIACFVMVGISAVMSGAIYVWISAPPAHASPTSASLTLTSASPLLWAGGDQVKSFTVAYASIGITWGSVLVSVDGAPISYQEGVSSGNLSWRAHVQGVVPTISQANALAIESGDEVELFLGHGSASGRVLTIVDPTSNHVLLTLTLA